MNFTNVPCIVKKWQCGVQFILMVLLVLIYLRMRGATYSNCECRAVQKSCWKHFSSLSYVFVSKIYCGSNKMEQLLTQHRFSCKFSGQCFGDITWSARSPDYFIWCYIKNRVYETRSANIRDLKQWNLECIQGIPKEMLQRVMTAFPSRLQECIERHGGHLQNVIFKQ